MHFSILLYQLSFGSIFVSDLQGKIWHLKMGFLLVQEFLLLCCFLKISWTILLHTDFLIENEFRLFSNLDVGLFLKINNVLFSHMTLIKHQINFMIWHYSYLLQILKLEIKIRFLDLEITFCDLLKCLFDMLMKVYYILEFSQNYHYLLFWRCLLVFLKL